MPATDDSFLTADIVREIEIGGATIRITARRLGDGWFGVWNCCCCGRSGVNGVVYHNAIMALDLTVESLPPDGCKCGARNEIGEFISATRCA
jgi:hypothetical protein